MLMDFPRNRVLPNQQFPRTDIDGDAAIRCTSKRMVPAGSRPENLTIRAGTNTINSQSFG